MMYGIVLEGGGGKGAYQFGAWKALNELGIEYNGVVGTSIGAINAALMVQDNFEAAGELWNKIHISASESIGTEIYHQLAAHEFKSKDPVEIKKEMQETFGIDGIDISTFRESVNAMIKEDIIRGSEKDFGMVTISLKQKKGLKLFKEDIPKGQLGDYMIASCYLPIYKTMLLNGDYFLDGSYYDRLPTDMLIGKGYKKIIEIRLYTPKPDEEKKNIPSDVHITTIYPKEYLGKALDFSKEQVLKNIKLGYADTLETLSQVTERKI
jgi:NTE family protein